MFLELGIAGLLSIGQPNLLGYEESSKVRPFVNFETHNIFMTYETELSKMQTVYYKTSVGYNFNDNISIGYEDQNHNYTPYGQDFQSSGQFVFVKLSYKFKE